MAPPKAKSTEAKSTEAKTVPVKALVTVNYDGTLYGPSLPDGDTFDCCETDLQQLKDVKAIEELPVDPAPAQ